MTSRSWLNLRVAVILLYSGVVLVTTLPGPGRIPNNLLLPYYIFLPGYALTLVLRQADGIIQTLFFSLVWSVVVLGSVYSLTTLAPNLSAIPLSGVIPSLTVILTVYGNYHER